MCILSMKDAMLLVVFNASPLETTLHFEMSRGARCIESYCTIQRDIFPSWEGKGKLTARIVLLKNDICDGIARSIA